MKSQSLTYFKENFELAYSCRVNWDEINIGYDVSCSIQLTKPEFENPFEHIDSIVWKDWKGTQIPFIMNSSKKDSILSKAKNNKVLINFDVTSAAWYLMSGKQELNNQNKDKYGRYKFEESIQHKLNIVGIPVVNYYFEVLKEAIEFVTNSKIESKREFSATITHDIDEVMSGWKHRVRTELNDKKYFNALNHGLSQLFKPFSPWKNLEKLADFNLKNKIPATIFILPRNTKVGGIKNADYEISTPYIQDSITYFERQNHEIGVHGSYKTHDSTEEFQKDIGYLKSAVKGNRFHFLQYEIQKTSEVVEKFGLKYDSTLGFQEEIGFRNSICTPFKLYNFKENCSFNFIEIPLNIMDCSLEYAHYMNLTTKDSLVAIKKLTREIKKFNGNLCVNWHNTYFSEYQKGDWKNLYEKIIEYLKEENCEFFTCSELVDGF